MSLEAVSNGEVTGDVLMNSTSIGMHDTEGQSPVRRQALAHYQLVFDAIYTPLRTQLIQVLASSPSTHHEGCCSWQDAGTATCLDHQPTKSHRHLH